MYFTIMIYITHANKAKNLQPLHPKIIVVSGEETALN